MLDAVIARNSQCTMYASPHTTLTLYQLRPAPLHFSVWTVRLSRGSHSLLGPPYKCHLPLIARMYSCDLLSETKPGVLRYIQSGRSDSTSLVTGFKAWSPSINVTICAFCTCWQADDSSVVSRTCICNMQQILAKFPRSGHFFCKFWLWTENSWSNAYYMRVHIREFFSSVFGKFYRVSLNKWRFEPPKSHAHSLLCRSLISSDAPRQNTCEILDEERVTVVLVVEQ